MLLLDGSPISATQFCNDTASLWGLLGLAIMVIKIVIPILLIVFGMLDMGKAVTSGKDDEIKKSAGAFGRRAVGAILVFLVPTIVGILMQVINSTVNDKAGEKESDGYCYCIKKATGWGKCHVGGE